MLDLRSKLNFGKYKGYTIAEVLDEYRGFEYLSWAIENLEWLRIEPELENYIRKTIELRKRDRELKSKINPKQINKKSDRQS